MSTCMKSATVLILIAGHLANAPRAQKEARALRAAGATVFVRGLWSSAVLAEEDISLARDMDVHFSPVADVRKRTMQSFFLRFRQLIARECFARLGWTTGRNFGLGVV